LPQPVRDLGAAPGKALDLIRALPDQELDLFQLLRDLLPFLKALF
jgi:hypothetical protein